MTKQILRAQQETGSETREHDLKKAYFTKPTNCRQCDKFIWGVLQKQGLECAACRFTCHFKCEAQVGKTCVGRKRNKSVVGMESVGAQLTRQTWRMMSPEELKYRVLLKDRTEHYGYDDALTKMIHLHSVPFPGPPLCSPFLRLRRGDQGCEVHSLLLGDQGPEVLGEEPTGVHPVQPTPVLSHFSERQSRYFLQLRPHTVLAGRLPARRPELPGSTALTQRHRTSECFSTMPSLPTTAAAATC